MNYWLEMDKKKDKQKKDLYKNFNDMNRFKKIWYKSLKNYLNKKPI